MAVLLFALEASHPYGKRLARELEMPLADHEERAFEDGEHKSRPLTDVRGHEVAVIHSLYGDAGQSPNDKLCRLLFFIGALKDAGAERVTAVVPYLCYGRKDRRTKAHDPITTKYVARLFEAVGTDTVVTLNVHNLAAFENAFRIRTVNLDAIPLFAEHFAQRLRHRPVAVVSPDVGGTKRAEAFRTAIARLLEDDPASGFVEKRRSSGVVSGEYFVGDVRERAVILLDDLISTGTTLRRAARKCREEGAQEVYAAATHGLFTGEAPRVLGDSLFDGVVVTDTVRSAAEDEGRLPVNVTILSSAPLVAKAIIV